VKKLAQLTFAGALGALILTIPAVAADQKPAAVPAKATTHSAVRVRSAWPQETLSGKISMVDPDRKLVVVKGPDGVPFDMVVTPKSHITSGDQALKFKDLAQDQNKEVSIQFIPERRGDVVKSMRIGG
jgi:hypothetical protein